MGRLLFIFALSALISTLAEAKIRAPLVNGADTRAPTDAKKKAMERKARAREKFKKAERDREKDMERWRSALEKRMLAEKRNSTGVADESRLEKSFNVWQLYAGRKLACRDTSSPRMLHKLRRFKRFWKAAVKKHDRAMGRLQTELVRYSEESTADEKDIVNTIDRSLSDEGKVKALKKLTKHNFPLLKKLTKRIDARLGTSSKVSIKTDTSLLNKAHRPSILQEHPWLRVEHIRDSLRFMTAIQDVGQIADILEVLAEAGIKLVKIDVKKLIRPKKWGWRFIAFDLRMENGQICEYYITFESLAKVMWDTHRIYERWRQAKSLRDNDPHFRNDVERSKTCYAMAFLSALNKGKYTANAFLEKWQQTLERMLHTLQTGMSPKGASKSVQRRTISSTAAQEAWAANGGLIAGVAVFVVLVLVWWMFVMRSSKRKLWDDKIDKVL